LKWYEIHCTLDANHPWRAKTYSSTSNWCENRLDQAQQPALLIAPGLGLSQENRFETSRAAAVKQRLWTVQNTSTFLCGTPRSGSSASAEVTEKGFANPVTTPGGITVQGGWPRSGAQLPTARWPRACWRGSRSFMASTGRNLIKTCTQVPVGDVLRALCRCGLQEPRKPPDLPPGAATQRIETRPCAKVSGADESRPKRHSCFKCDRTIMWLHHQGLGHIGRVAAQARPQRGRRQSPHARESGLFDARQGGVPTGPPRLWSTRCAASGTFVIEREIAMGLNPAARAIFAFEGPRELLIPINGPLCVTISATSDAAAVLFRPRRRPSVNRARMKASGTAGVSDGSCQCSKPMPRGSYPARTEPPGLLWLTRPTAAASVQETAFIRSTGRLDKRLLTRFKGWRVGLVNVRTPLAKPPVCRGETPKPAHRPHRH